MSDYQPIGDALDAVVAGLTEEELAAAQALYDDPDIEVGHEGIGGFAADQAERTIAALKKAGFRVEKMVAPVSEIKHPQHRLVGGPMDGVLIEFQPHVSLLVKEGDPEWEGMAYHRTRIPTGTDPSLDWFIMDLPEPTWETVFEWHEIDWVPPVVQAIRDAVRDASDQ